MKYSAIRKKRSAKPELGVQSGDNRFYFGIDIAAVNQTTRLLSKG